MLLKGKHHHSGSTETNNCCHQLLCFCEFRKVSYSGSCAEQDADFTQSMLVLNEGFFSISCEITLCHQRNNIRCFRIIQLHRDSLQ